MISSFGVFADMMNLEAINAHRAFLGQMGSEHVNGLMELPGDMKTYVHVSPDFHVFPCFRS